MPQTPLLERAFELARSGQCSTGTEVGKALKREGYWGIDPAFAGASIRRELRALIREAEQEQAA